LVYFAGSQQLMQWKEGALASTSYVPDGEVLRFRLWRRARNWRLAKRSCLIEQVSFTDGSVSETRRFPMTLARCCFSRVPWSTPPVVTSFWSGRRKRHSLRLPGSRGHLRHGRSTFKFARRERSGRFRSVPGKERLFLLPESRRDSDGLRAGANATADDRGTNGAAEPLFGGRHRRDSGYQRSTTSYVAAGSPTIAHFAEEHRRHRGCGRKSRGHRGFQTNLPIVNTSSPPYTIAPNNVLPFDFYVQFTAAAPRPTAQAFKSP